MSKSKKKKSNKRMPLVLIIIVVGVIVYFAYNPIGTTFKTVTIKNNDSIKYSNKMLNSLVSEDSNKNVLFSELTLNPTLTFYYEEGNAKVKDELNKYFNNDSNNLIDNYNQIYKRYKNSYKRVDYDGSFWINSNLGGISKNAKKTADKLHFKLMQKDFSKQSDVNKINRWITKKSHNKVKGNFKKGELQDKHSVVLGTLYFNEKWQEKYEDSDIIENGTFSGTKGQQKVTYLSSEENTYLHTNNARGFMKPYKDNDLYFVGVIPEDGYELKDIDLTRLMRSASNQEVNVRIPEFEYEYEKDLTENLKDMGINSLFEVGNLDNIANDLYVDKIVQKNYIRVDRKGTEAFSVNMAINGQWGSVSRPNVVYLDRPFIFMIYDRSIDQALFIGQVNNVEDLNE